MDKIDNIGLTRMLTQSYDFEGFTEQEVWSRIAQRMNIIIEHFNYLESTVKNKQELIDKKLDYLINEGLPIEIAKAIREKIEDGTIGKLINETLLQDINNKIDENIEKVNEQLDTNVSNLNEKIDTFKTELNEQLDTKANDNEVVKKGQGTLDDFNEETRRVILGIEEGQINAVLGNKNVTKRNIKDNEVCFNHLNEQGNLINSSTVLYNKIITQEGVETDLVGHYSTDYINIESDDTYSITHVLTSTGAWYDENKEFLSRIIVGNPIGENHLIKSPKNAKFVKLNFRYNDVKPNDCGLFYGEVSSNSGKKIKQLKVGNENYENNSIEYKHLKNGHLKLTNLIDKSKIKINTFLDEHGNEVVAKNDNIWTTDFMPIDDTQCYMAKELLPRPGLWYDCNKQVISWLPNNSDEPTLLIPPKGACYCRWVGDTSCPIETTMFIKGDTYPSYYIPYTDHDRFEINGLEIKDSNIINETYKGRKYLVLGDSISANKTVAGVFYHDYLSEYFGLDKTNKAVSGSGWCVSSSANDNIMQIISRIQESYDLITIFAGTNDYGRTGNGINSKPFGTYGDTTEDTFCGTVYRTLIQLIEKFVDADIIVITPIPRENHNTVNKYGKTLKDYRDIILKTCEALSIPCIDLYKESGIYVFNSEFKTTYIPDGLHPNKKGHKKIANKVINEVKKYISII